MKLFWTNVQTFQPLHSIENVLGQCGQIVLVQGSVVNRIEWFGKETSIENKQKTYNISNSTRSASALSPMQPNRLLSKCLQHKVYKIEAWLKPSNRRSSRKWLTKSSTNSVQWTFHLWCPSIYYGSSHCVQIKCFVKTKTEKQSEFRETTKFNYTSIHSEWCSNIKRSGGKKILRILLSNLHSVNLMIVCEYFVGQEFQLIVIQTAVRIWNEIEKNQKFNTIFHAIFNDILVTGSILKTCQNVHLLGRKYFLVNQFFLFPFQK